MISGFWIKSEAKEITNQAGPIPATATSIILDFTKFARCLNLFTAVDVYFD